jgi:aarF domain-containing kinase
LMVSDGATHLSSVRLADWLVDVAGSVYHALRCMVRCLQLICIALPPVMWLPLHVLLSSTVLHHGRKTQSDGSISCSLMVRLLCNALERAGPTAIKLGQWASTRPDLFPPELCNHLSARLHAAVAPHSTAHSRQALEAVLTPAGLTLADVFEHLDFDTAPLGSGCVAQVHGGTLRTDVARRAWAQAHTEAQIPTGLLEERDEDSRHVVVKILHPGVAESVALDMALLECGAGLVTHWLSMLPMLGWLKVLRLPELTLQFKFHLLSQLDLRTECENLREFRRNFAGRVGRRTTDEAVFPTPLAVLPLRQETDGNDDNSNHERALKWCPATPNVLVESLERGIGLDRWLVYENQAPRHRRELVAIDGKLDAWGNEKTEEHERRQREQMRRRLAESGVVAFFQMVLVDNFVHADLHPGNILLRSRTQDATSGTRCAAAERDSAGDTSTDTASSEVPTLVFLDAGLVVRLSEKEKRNFCDLFLAVARGQGTKAGELIIDRSPGGRDGVKRNGGDPDRFVRAIAAVVEDVAARKFHLGSVAIGPVLLAVLSAVRMDRVPLDPAFGNLVSAIVVLEGIGRQLHPELDLFAVAVPMLAKHAVTSLI